MSSYFKALLAGLAALLWIDAAAAQKAPYFFDVPGYTQGTANTPITRPNNTTQYTSTATICQSASAVCTPGVATIANAANGGGFLNHVTMFKSGSTTSNAAFTIWMFSQPPVLTSPTQEDNVAYAGPRTADAPNYIGNAACTTTTATSDTSAGVWFDCTLSNPNTSGALVFQTSGAVPSVIYFLISDSGATGYTPVANETFTPYFSGFY